MNDVESIVNKKNDIRRCTMLRAIVTRRQRRLKKLLATASGFALVAICTISFAVIGAVHPLLAVAVSVTALMLACFLFGLYVEAKRACNRR